MRPLTNPIRNYAWGSRTALAALQGRRVPSQRPEAELWIGAHPGDPSSVDSGGSLLDVIVADPTAVLGEGVAAAFGARLPYLLKIIAADEPLSLQAHPDADQAQAGFAAEESAGVAPAERNYVDPHHKPELLVAVGEFEALCGFRPPNASADVLAALGVPQLAPVIELLRGADVSAALAGAVTSLMTWPADERKSLVDAVAAAGGATGTASGTLAAQLADRYPGDVGVIVALLLNHVRLRAGEAVWMPAGNLHAYLRGVGVEIMAASDNVLRGGLTPKRVDVPELLRVLRFEVLDEPVVPPVPVSGEVVTWPTPIDEFRLVRASVTVDGPRVTLPVDGPRAVLCVSGRVSVADGDRSVDLTAGHAVFVGADRPAVQVTGAGTVFQAGTPASA